MKRRNSRGDFEILNIEEVRLISCEGKFLSYITQTKRFSISLNSNFLKQGIRLMERWPYKLIHVWRTVLETHFWHDKKSCFHGQGFENLLSVIDPSGSLFQCHRQKCL